MIRIAAIYPRQPGKRFDLDYYINFHLPSVREKFGSFGMIKAEVDQGIEKPGGGDSPFFAIGYLYFNTLDDFHKAFAAVGAEVIRDIALYTDVTPMIQIGETLDV